MVKDVRAAAQWLATRPNVRGDAVAIVGASLGASLALLDRDPEVARSLVDWLRRSLLS